MAKKAAGAAGNAPYSNYIFEYYDKNGFFDIDAGVDDEENIDVDDLISFVKKQLRKDPDNVVDPDDVQSIVLGELDYEESLGMY